MASSIAWSAGGISSGARKARTALAEALADRDQVVHGHPAAPIQRSAPFCPLGGETRLPARDGQRDPIEVDGGVAEEVAQPDFVVSRPQRRIAIHGRFEGARRDRVCVGPQPVGACGMGRGEVDGGQAQGGVAHGAEV